MYSTHWLRQSEFQSGLMSKADYCHQCGWLSNNLVLSLISEGFFCFLAQADLEFAM